MFGYLFSGVWLQEYMINGDMWPHLKYHVKTQPADTQHVWNKDRQNARSFKNIFGGNVCLTIHIYSSMFYHYRSIQKIIRLATDICSATPGGKFGFPIHDLLIQHIQGDDVGEDPSVMSFNVKMPSSSDKPAARSASMTAAWAEAIVSNCGGFFFFLCVFSQQLGRVAPRPRTSHSIIHEGKEVDWLR